MTDNIKKLIEANKWQLVSEISNTEGGDYLLSYSPPYDCDVGFWVKPSDDNELEKAGFVYFSDDKEYCPINREYCRRVPDDRLAEVCEVLLNTCNGALEVSRDKSMMLAVLNSGLSRANEIAGGE